MKIPNSPFLALDQELLMTLFLGGDCIGYQNIEVGNFAPSTLTVPHGAVYALIIAEADPGVTNKSRIMRFKETTEEPTDTDGMPMGDLSVYEVKGAVNMQNFKIISIESGVLHVLRVQYFG
jgi:hypothetical protein